MITSRQYFGKTFYFNAPGLYIYIGKLRKVKKKKKNKSNQITIMFVDRLNLLGTIDI